MAKEKSKLGRLIKEKGLTQIQFAELVFQKRGYFIEKQIGRAHV